MTNVILCILGKDRMQGIYVVNRLSDESVRGFKQDEHGVWWHSFSDGRRVRGRYVPCKACGSEFIVWRERSKYCSSECEKARYQHVTWTRKCKQCQREFTTDKKLQRFCSHSCAALRMHENAPQTTTKRDRPETLVNSGNPRYYQDDSGQWWYEPGGSKTHSRTRAHVSECPWCSSKFLKSAYDLEQQFCSRRCGVQASVAAGTRADQSGTNGTNWKGGRRIDHRGYVLLWAPDHPSRANTAKPYVFEHRLVMEARLGRFLQPHENVHHINGQRDDNRDENLELWSTWQPCGQRVKDKMKWVWEMVELYEHLYPRPNPV